MKGEYVIIPSCIVITLALCSAWACGIGTPRAPSDTHEVRSIEPVDQWGQLRLGMTQRQVRSVKGIRWVERSGTDPLTGKPWRAFTARGSVPFYGSPASLYVDFQDGVVHEIGMSKSLPEALTPKSCEGAFLQLVREVETTYGPFVPLIPSGLTVVGTTREVTEAHVVPDASSTFSLTSTLSEDPRVPVFTTLAARRWSQSSAADVSGGWSTLQGGETKCSSLSFRIRAAH